MAGTGKKFNGSAHVEVANAAARNAYPVSARKWGMRITEIDTQRTYVLKRLDISYGKDQNANWQLEPFVLEQTTVINSNDVLPTSSNAAYSKVITNVFVDCTAGNVTLTVPAPVANNEIRIKRVDNSANKVLFAGATIDDVTPYLGAAGIPAYGTVKIMTDAAATKWYTL